MHRKVGFFYFWRVGILHKIQLLRLVLCCTKVIEASAWWSFLIKVNLLLYPHRHTYNYQKISGKNKNSIPICTLLILEIFISIFFWEIWGRIQKPEKADTKTYDMLLLRPKTDGSLLIIIEIKSEPKTGGLFQYKVNRQRLLARSNLALLSPFAPIVCSCLR